ncbi:MAG: hypothetical protein Q8N84_00045 [bacterium]|nr:hypothetical protein [bacterium]
MEKGREVVVGKWYIVGSDPHLKVPLIFDGPFDAKEEASELIDCFPDDVLIRQWDGKEWVK